MLAHLTKYSITTQRRTDMNRTHYYIYAMFLRWAMELRPNHSYVLRGVSGPVAFREPIDDFDHLLYYYSLADT